MRYETAGKICLFSRHGSESGSTDSGQIAEYMQCGRSFNSSGIQTKQTVYDAGKKSRHQANGVIWMSRGKNNGATIRPAAGRMGAQTAEAWHKRLTLYVHADLCRKGYYNEFHGMTGLNANREPEEAAASVSSILNQQGIRVTVFQKLQNHTMIQRVQGEKEYE